MTQSLYRVFRFTPALGAFALLAACVTPPTGQSSGQSPAQAATLSTNGPEVQRFKAVVARMEPVAETICRQRVSANVNCDFKIVLDTDPRKPSNAYQSQEASGRPVLTFTLALLADARNSDEIAFVLGHEAAHHIRGHLAETRQTAMTGAILAGGLAAILGGGQVAVDTAVDLGGTVGARAFSKDHELEADALGARITYQAGYDPLRGAEFFSRIPDPGDRFLGSHPPNAQRIETVRQTVAGF